MTRFPVDALAVDFDGLLLKHTIVFLLRTAKVHAEKLASAFASDYFDLAYAQNSLDHCYDPLTAIRQMVQVVRPNHFVLLAHTLMEGKNENYQGLHQWDFFAREGDFMLKYADRTEINASHSLKEIADVTCDTANGGILVKIQKKDAV